MSSGQRLQGNKPVECDAGPTRDSRLMKPNNGTMYKLYKSKKENYLLQGGGKKLLLAD